MRKSEPNHRLKSGIGVEQPRSFSETAIETLEWQRDEFSGRIFKGSASKGKEEIRSSFISQEGFEDNPEKMVRILGFLTSKMKIDDNGQLRAMLNKLKGEGSVSVLPTDKKSPPPDVLRKLLRGEFDETLETSDIARRGQAYTLALYLYMHTTTDSEQEIMNTLEQLIISYNDPNVNFDEYQINGLKTEPHLVDMCVLTIEKYGLSSGMRERFKDVFERKSSPSDSIYKRNVRLVIPEKH